MNNEDNGFGFLLLLEPLLLVMVESEIGFPGGIANKEDRDFEFLHFCIAILHWKKIRNFV